MILITALPNGHHHQHDQDQDHVDGGAGQDGLLYADHVDVGIDVDVGVDGAVGEDGPLYRAQTLAKETAEGHSLLLRTVQESSS